MRIPPGNDAGAAGAATAGSEIGLIETAARCGEPVNIRRARSVAAIAAEIVPAYVVADEEDEIRALCRIKVPGNGHGAGAKCSQNTSKKVESDDHSSSHKRAARLRRCNA